MAKIAADLTQALARRAAEGGPGRLDARVLASGDGWTVQDVVCSCGPDDRPFEEQHNQVAIAIVTAGSFQYRGSGAAAGRELMTPGSLLLGSPGQYFECGHEHAAGDRCLSFRYSLPRFEAITNGVPGRGRRLGFGLLRLPPLRPLSPVIARANAALAEAADGSWEELSVMLAGRAVQFASGSAPSLDPPTNAAISRVTRAIRLIEERRDEPLTLDELARYREIEPVPFPAHVQGSDRGDAASIPDADASSPGGCAAARRARQDSRGSVRERLRRRLEFQPRIPRGIRRQPARVPAGFWIAGRPRTDEGRRRALARATLAPVASRASRSGVRSEAPPRFHRRSVHQKTAFQRLSPGVDRSAPVLRAHRPTHRATGRSSRPRVSDQGREPKRARPVPGRLALQPRAPGLRRRECAASSGPTTQKSAPDR